MSIALRFEFQKFSLKAYWKNFSHFSFKLPNNNKRRKKKVKQIFRQIKCALDFNSGINVRKRI